MGKKYDFGGYATRNDLLCGDGRTIRQNAFKDCDGLTVPLIWNHDHNNPDAVLGHALLENREDGVYAYCTFNDTEQGKNAKSLVKHGDVRSLSIYANRLKQLGNDVVHGIIRELSLVLMGANPGAYIDFVMAHGEGEDDALYANYDETTIIVQHSDDDEADEKDVKKEEKEDDDVSENDKTLKEIIDGMTEEQKDAMAYVVAEALEHSDNEEGDDDMKYNPFDNSTETKTVLSHADQEYILKMAKTGTVGTLQRAISNFADENSMAHADVAAAGGFIQTGEGNVTELFPEYKDLKPGAPELITNDQGWISVVMGKVHKSPISRIRTSYVDIRNLENLRAKGYTKGKEKQLTGQIALAKRTTDPQTIYVKNALHRDDIIDITDFDYVSYMYNIDKLMLNEELATAIMIGDGRDIGDEDKIAEDKIRPIWKDDEVYTLHVDVDLAKAEAELQGTETGAHFGKNYIMAEAMTETILHAKEKYKGTGTPDLYITPYNLNVMLLARDMNGRRIYSSRAELASTLGVGNIYTVEQFEGKTRTDKDGKVKKLIGLVVNLNDYALGATKGGQVTHFTQFDIDFNQQKSLIETRCSGALTKLASAIAIEDSSTEAAG